jgi:Mn2+/Fe2+ NRAMP family transporter
MIMRSKRTAHDQLSASRRFLKTLGPGLVVMLANTEAGSIMTAAQSGAEWGYSLLLFQVVIIPLLFIVQEMALRLALGTGRGMGELVRTRFGVGASSIMTAVLAISCFGSLVTQLSGLAGVGQLLSIPVWQMLAAAICGVSLMVLTGSYHAVERIAILFGAFELAFIYAGWKSDPDVARLLAEVGNLSTHDPRYLYLLAANLGTSLMPWAIFYQQSAIVDKGLTLESLKLARLETLLGAVLCQIVTCGVLVTAAAYASTNRANLGDVPAIALMFEKAFGSPFGGLVFGAGLLGGAVVATVVVCLASGWAIGEVSGLRHSLEHHPKDAPWFYLSFVALLAAGGLFVASGINVVKLSIAVGVINALLLPSVLLFLFLLARRELEPSLRPTGVRALLIAILFVTTSSLGLYAGIVGALG